MAASPTTSPSQFSRWTNLVGIALLAGSFVTYFCLVVVAERLATGSWIYLEQKRVLQLGLLLLAGGLLVKHDTHPAAQVGALFLAAAGTAPAFPFEEMVSIWRHLPPLLSALLWPAQASHFLLPFLFFLFYALLPGPVSIRNYSRFLFLVPLLVPMGWGLYHLWKRIYLHFTPEVPHWVLLCAGVSILFYCFGGLMAFTRNWYRLDIGPQRTRYRWFVIGWWVGWAPGLLFLSAIFLGPVFPDSSFVWFFVSPIFKNVALACWPVVLLTFAGGMIKNQILKNA